MITRALIQRMEMAVQVPAAWPPAFGDVPMVAWSRRPRYQRWSRGPGRKARYLARRGNLR
jgi:hypothetical protein